MRAFLKAVAIGALVFLPSCDYEVRKKEKFHGSVEDVIREVSSPKEAQRFINKYIDYDNSRSENDGVTCYSLEKLLEVGSGVCRDAGACGIPAMLKDDGFPSLYVTIKDGNGGDGHGVFVFQKDGKWGSAGINAEDFHDAEFGSLDDLMKTIASDFGMKYVGYWLHDLTTVNTAYGVFKNSARFDIFTIEGYDSRDGLRIDNGDVVIENNVSGWVVTKTRKSGTTTTITRNEYDSLLQRVRMLKTGDNKSDGVIEERNEWVRTSVWPNGATASGVLEQRIYQNGVGALKMKEESRYDDDGEAVYEKQYFDDNLDGVFDKIVERTKIPNSVWWHVKYDDNADGIWDRED